MATNNLLVNNERKVLYEQQSKVERSGHNLSQSRKFPCDVGYIYPFFCRKTLPSDSFKISADILIKQLQPLLVPQMVSFTVNTAFYWVDYSLAFPEFEYFLINQKGQHTIELPYIHLRNFSGDDILLPELSTSTSDKDNKSAVPLFENVRTFLDITPNASNEKVDALPFWTYRTIVRDFYTNIDRLSDIEYERLFPSNISDHYLKQGENKFYNNSVLDFDQLSRHNVRGDYFVNSYPTPLRGDVPTLTLSSEVSDLTANLSGSLKNLSLATLSTIDIDRTTPYFFGPGNFNKSNVIGDTEIQNEEKFISIGQLYGNPSEFAKLQVTTSPYHYTGQSQSNTWKAIQSQYDQLHNALVNPQNFSGQISLSNLSNFETSISVSTRQLRLLESLTRKREIDIMMKPRLKNYLQTYFGVNRYKDDSLYQPVFIGSTTQQILINDIAQTTATSESPLGRQGATAMSLGSGYVGEYYCRNYGCLMGLMYILPDYDYEPAIPREWQERTPDDFVNPEFTHLSMQPILNKELFVSSNNDWNNEVLGYMGMYDNYRTSQNLVAGDFLNPNYGDIRQFAQVRRFDNNNKPEITTQFLDSNSAFDRTVFANPSLPPFIAQCVARVEAVRPLPQIAIPRG